MSKEVDDVGGPTFIFDPLKNSTDKKESDRVSTKLTEYMKGYSPAGDILIALYDSMGYNFFAVMEIELPEVRGKWVEYVYKKYCMEIPWEWSLGIKEGTLIEKLLVDEEFCSAHPKFKKRIAEKKEQASVQVKVEQAKVDSGRLATLADIRNRVAKDPDAKLSAIEVLTLIDSAMGVEYPEAS